MYRTDISVNGNIIIVQYDEQVSLAGSGIVQSLECETACKRAVTYQCHRLMILSLHLSCFGKAKRCRNGSRRVSYTESVVLALRTFRETADSVFCPISFEGLTTSRNDLMGISLMTNIENDLILRGIIHIMQSDDKFYSTEARSEMARIHCATLDHVLTYLLTQGAKLINTQTFDITRRVYLIQKLVCHNH